MKVLSLDTSTVTGWVLVDSETRRVLDHGHINVRKFFHSDYGAMGRFFHNALCDLMTTHEPDVFCIEKPFMRGATTYHLFGLCFVAHMVASARGVRRFEVTPQQAKKHLTGSREATKDEMVEAALANGYDMISSDHEADALAVGLFVIDSFLTQEV